MTARHGLTQMSMKKNQAIAPLRRIIETTYDNYGLDADRLECGHTQLSPIDITGHATSAVRRRCRECARGAGPLPEDTSDA